MEERGQVTTHRPDRRVQRTRVRLHEALASLIHEKPYEGVVVKEILGRADVGRSTFYSHFRNKEELLDSSIREILQTGRAAGPRAGTAADEILQSAQRIFEHIERHLTAGTRLDGRGQASIHDRLQKLLVRHVANALKQSPPDRRDSRCDLPDELIAQFAASTFVVVLQWQLESNGALTSGEASRMFRRLVAPVLS
jgi:AcrR family transcriptional regulator